MKFRREAIAQGYYNWRRRNLVNASLEAKRVCTEFFYKRGLLGHHHTSLLLYRFWQKNVGGTTGKLAKYTHQNYCLR